MSILKDIDSSKLAHELSQMQIDCIRTHAEQGGELVADRLAQLRDIVWDDPAPSSNIQSDHHEEFAKIFSDLTPEQHSLLLEAYARMGHLGEIAGLAARENYFVDVRANGGKIPGGVAEFLENENNIATAIEKLNQPVLEVVMTMHPTNVNSLESMQAQRTLAKGLNDLSNGGETTEEQIREMVERYQSVPVLHQLEGKDSNFTVTDETKMVINSLTNLYDDLSKTYAEYDNAFRGKFGDEYKPDQLNLKIHAKSWGSAGDKDGNNNVTAEKTLEAIAMHTAAILTQYQKDLQQLDGAVSERWQEKLGAVQSELEPLLPQLEALRMDTDAVRKGDKELPAQEMSDRFDSLSKQLAEIRSALVAQDFEQDLQKIYDNVETKEQKDKSLDLLRKAKTFGFEFGKIEYRETAEEYSRVVGTMIDGYEDMSTEQRQQKLTELLQEGSTAAQELYAKAKENIIANGVGKIYSGDDALPIAYHSLKRMELARDHAGMIEDNVLAEAGKLPEGTPSEDAKKQGVVNMLEAQFLQQAVTDKNGKRALLGIIPLFEEPETMENVGDIMRNVYDNPAYQHHLQLLAESRHDGKKTQQVQIAHSDNARRAGVPAARAYIHEAHKKLSALNEEYGIESQFFVGGSISDAYRNGVRALTASVNAFGMHKFAKFTFQGGDLLNYFNMPSSSTRLFTRHFTHAAEKLERQAGTGEWRIKHNGKAQSDILDDIAINALKPTVNDYTTYDFTSKGMGILLAAIGYDQETKMGNRGSRAPARKKGLAFAKVDSVQLGATIEPVPISKVRTIGFSEGWQQNALVPSWIGSQHLENHIKQQIIKKLDEVDEQGAGSLTSKQRTDLELFLEEFSDIKETGELSAHHLKVLYDRSPTFRDAMDKAAQAVAMTDIEQTKHLAYQMLAARKKDTPEEARIKEEGRSYMAQLQQTYQSIGRMTYAALTGDSLGDGYRVKHLRHEGINAKVADALTQALPNLARDIVRKTQYRDALMYLKMNTVLDDHDAGLVHAAGDTVMHGRFTMADDPAYGKHRNAALMKPRSEDRTYLL